ncbi:hypothetical protein [Pseudomonas sp. FGI182]|uniref:hypothetical protein n=1 Tax=Pseudomonas sp. FGI182 TaxID=1259844 RepID=UPI000429C050|nr:hypothetical protein [Pseudomonas sp. FGI182]
MQSMLNTITTQRSASLTEATTRSKTPISVFANTTMVSDQEKTNLNDITTLIVFGEKGDLSTNLKHHNIAESRPAFYINHTVANTLIRKNISPPPPKKYQGYDRLNQALRQISLAVNTAMNLKLNSNPLEVQASVFCNLLHLSSNFHTDKIQEALRIALTDSGLFKSAQERVQPHEREDWDKVLSARRARHHRKLMETFASLDSVLTTISKAHTEIIHDRGIRPGTNLTKSTIALQCKAGFLTIFKVFEDIKRFGASSHIMVHSPPQNMESKPYLPEGVTETMHAEQTIEEYLAKSADIIYDEAIAKLDLQAGQHIIVNMAGRFVPCAVCKEVEHSSTNGGVFDPKNNKFVLWRSSERIGMAFKHEVQHLALHALHSRDAHEALKKALKIRDGFILHQETLQSYGAPVVTCFSLDTDSESSDDQGND